ncbi:unnamed protein product [Orchesella dallaii]|uniref:Uncharacterized protein n=1 Tax=Orchesella dallaii TaxID=48710 RepID=A0ABP1QD59_9HEXA
MSPRPFTAESLKIIDQRRLAQKQGGKEEPGSRIDKSGVGSNHPDIRLRTDTQLPKHMRLFFTPDMTNIPLNNFVYYISNLKLSWSSQETSNTVSGIYVVSAIKDKYYDCHELGDNRGSFCAWGSCPDGWKTVKWDNGCVSIGTIVQRCCIHE